MSPGELFIAIQTFKIIVVILIYDQLLPSLFIFSFFTNMFLRFQEINYLHPCFIYHKWERTLLEAAQFPNSEFIALIKAPPPHPKSL